MIITIRDIELTTADFTDRDVLALAQIGNDNLPRDRREKEAADALATIFPDLPPAWIAGGRVRLNTYELLPIIAALTAEVEKLPDMLQTMKLIQEMPQVAPETVEQARQAQALLERIPQGFVPTSAAERQVKAEREARLSELRAELAILESVS